MLGISFPISGQKAFENNRNLAQNASSFRLKDHNNFINPPQLKSEITLGLLKQLNQVKKYVLDTTLLSGDG